MTDIDIIRMAKEASGDDWGIFRDFMPEIERFAELVAAAVMPKEALAEMFEWGKDAGRREEREACAKVCEDASKPHDGEMHSDSQWAGLVLATTIRARGQK